MRLGAGHELIRKNKDGGSLSWTIDANATLRVQMRPGSYLELEREAVGRFEDYLRE
jgi:hypothetical protein